MTEYTTRQGDTWDLISFRAYGTEAEIPRLLEANFGLRHIAIFPADIKVQIPELPVQPCANLRLPPWKR